MNKLDASSGNGTRKHRPANGHWTFLRRFLAEPNVVGSLWPSSRRLAQTLIAPFAGRAGPTSVLEVGAGTGVVTREIGLEMGDQDQLTVCEIQPDLVNHLEVRVLSQPPFEAAWREHRVELFCGPVQNLDRTPRFDYVISGLPFAAFTPEDVQSALDVIRSVLVPGGIFSYFEYAGLRRLRAAGSVGAARRKVSAVATLMEEHAARNEIGRKLVVGNFPPARVRYWRFRPASSAPSATP